MTLYDDLGVNTDASEPEIKKAYKRQAQKNHPYKETGDIHKFKQISHAYKVLSDQSRRKKYDENGDESNVDNEQIERTTMLSQLFIKFIDSGKRGNLIELAIKEIQGKIDETQQKALSIKIVINNLETQIGRVVTHNKQVNLFEAAILSKLEIAKIDIENLDRFENQMKALLKMRDDYEDCLTDDTAATSPTMMQTNGYFNI